MPKYKVKMSHTTEFFIEAETQEELIDYMCEHTPDDFKEIGVNEYENEIICEIREDSIVDITI